MRACLVGGAGDSPEVCRRSFAALRMTARSLVILSDDSQGSCHPERSEGSHLGAQEASDDGGQESCHPSLRSGSPVRLRPADPSHEALRTSEESPAETGRIKAFSSPNIHKPCHLVANCLIVSTVAQLSWELTRLHHEGYPLDPAAIITLNPYRTSSLDQFGR